LISEDELQVAFKKYVNQKFTVSELQSIVAEIWQIYAARGYVAQGKLPRQDVTDGVITIEIIEAKFGGVLFDPEQKKNLQRVAPELIEKFVSSGQVIGTSINSANLDRALLITDDLPGIAIQGSLAEGEKMVRPKSLLRLKISLFTWVMFHLITKGHVLQVHLEKRKLELAKPDGIWRFS